MASNGESAVVVSDTVCIRPSHAWPMTKLQLDAQQARCAEDGFVQAGSSGVHLHALFSGCGPHAAQAAVAASIHLQGSLAHLLDDHGSLTTSALVAAFQQCHQQLLQQQHQQQHGQQPQQQTTNCSGNSINLSHSGASALLVALDPAQQRLLVASAGLCRAVLARSTPTGDLTVMELTTYLALGHDATETARLDAAGSSICYPAAGAVHRDYQGTATRASNSSSPQTLYQPEAVLVGPDGQVLPGVKASRMLGYTSAAAAGVVSTPVVTSWRLTGAESFIVLGTPGLWAAMTPAEVADYVAAALSAGVSSTYSSMQAPTAPAADDGDGNAGAETGSSAAAAAASVGDLLTLEAQERLKLKLMDRLFGLCPGPAAAGSCSSGVVPDVSAVVLQLGSSPGMPAVAVDKQKVTAELTHITRSCTSNAEAVALQASWSASSEPHDSAAAVLAAPPAPALPSLLPVLTVAGGSWPAAFWPNSDPIRVPALAPAAAPQAAVSRAGVWKAGQEGTQKFSFEEAAEAAGLLRRSSSHSISSSGAQAARSTAFALSSRLSCELDLSHDHGSQGSCGCLTAECNTSAVGSPSEQSMILHKVRLAGAGELESLLFANATTSHPDTTVARVMPPWGGSLGSSLSGWRSSDTLVVAAATAGAVSSSRRSVSRVYSHAALQPREQQQAAPRRSASVLIAALNMNHRQSAEETGSESNSASGADNLQHSAAATVPSSLSNPLLYSYSGSLLDNHEQQQQQQHEEGEVRTVKKARSYQALSALQAAGVRSLPTSTLDQPSLVTPNSLAVSGLSKSVQAQPAGLIGSPIQRFPAAGAFISSAFRPAFQAQDRAMSTVPAGAASDALQASVASVSMPLSCPLGGLATDLMSPQDNEGRVRGGVTRDNRSSSFRASLEAAAGGADGIAAALQAAAAAAAAEESCEGKVRHGVPRGRSFRLSTDEAAAASTAAQAAAAVAGPRLGLKKAVSAFAAASMHPVGSEDTEGTVSSKASSAATTASIEGSSSISSSTGWCNAVEKVGRQPASLGHTAAATAADKYAEQPSSRPESCVRGGRARAASMRAAFSSPDLPSLAHSCAAPDAAYEAALLQPFRKAATSYGDSSSRTLAGSAGGLHSSSLVAGDTAGRLQLASAFAAMSSAFSTSSSAASAAAAAAAASSAAIATGESSSPFAGSTLCATSAAGPVSCGVSDGAVHGGELGDESLEGQVHNGRRSNSLSTSLSGLLPSLSGSLSPSDNAHLTSTSTSRHHLPLRRCASSYTHSSSNTAANPGAHPGVSSSSWSSSFVSVSPATGDVSFSSWQQQEQQEGKGCLRGLGISSPAGTSPCAAAPAIEVLRMPSGSFTRVRMSASAPADAAAAPGAQGLAADAASVGGHVFAFASALDLGPTSSGELYSQPITGTASLSAAAPGASRFGQFTRVHSTGSDRRAASSAGAAVGASGYERAAAGSWSSSRAWGSGSSRRPTIQFGKVQLPHMQSAFAPAATSDADADSTSGRTRSRGSRDGGRVQGLLPLAIGDTGNRAGSELNPVPPALPSPGPRRQKSQTLPTLKETPTPSSSPQLASSSSTSTSRTLDLLNSSDLGDPVAQQRQQQQQESILQQQMAELIQEASLSDQQFQGSLVQQAGEVCHESSTDRSEHSATGLMESLESSGGSLTDLLLEDCEQSAAGDPDEIAQPGSPGSQAQPGRQSFEFRRHVSADALYGCSPAPMGTSAQGTNSRLDR